MELVKLPAKKKSFTAMVNIAESLDSRTLLAARIVSTAAENPTDLVDFDGALFFAAADGLWRSDGTASGTVRVSETGAHDLTVVNDMLFFSGDGAGGRELWKTDGTSSGTSRVKDIVAGAASSSPSNLTAVNDLLFFTATGGELWKSDGTSGGTQKIRKLFSSDDQAVTNLAGIGNKLYFTLESGVGTAFGPTDCDLWSSDGTQAGTAVVYDLFPITDITATRQTVYFAAEHFQTDPDAGPSSTHLLRADPASGVEEFASFSEYVYGDYVVSGLTEFRGLVYYIAESYEPGSTDPFALWKTDGTQAGTGKVKEIGPYIFSHRDNRYPPQDLTVVSDTLYFSASPTGELGFGFNLWKSDGTADGTVIVAMSESISALTAGPQRLYFVKHDSVHGEELWESNGTIAGTRIVVDARLGTDGSTPSAITRVGDRVFFVANDSVNRRGVRQVMPAAALDNGVLNITGTEAGDVISIKPLGSSRVKVTVNEEPYELSATAVTRIEMTGLSGNDLVDFSARAEPISLDTATGNDTIVAGAGNDKLTGGDGDDRIFGGPGDDLISGNAHRDWIDAGLGDDRVNGQGGRDRIFGGDGADRIYGGLSGDWLFGQSGPDQIFGEGGNDRLYGGASADRLSGQGGDDQLFGESGNDRLSGGMGGRDTLHGNTGDDRLISNDGNIDELFGDGGNDSVTADVDDILNGIETTA